MHTRQWIRCISSDWWLERECRQATATWLSQWEVTQWLLQCLPHVAAASIVDVVSLGSGHPIPLQTTVCHMPCPTPQSEVSSVTSYSSMGVKNEIPFQEVTNSLYHAKSDPYSGGPMVFSILLVWVLWRRSIIVLRKAHPACTTLHVWLDARSGIQALATCILVCRSTLPASMLINLTSPLVRHFVGPSQLCAAIGTPNCPHTLSRVPRALWHPWESGGPATKKLS